MYVRVCRSGELPEGSARQVTVAGRPLALFRIGGRIFAVEDTCLHAGGPLHKGRIEGHTVVCPWHDWAFDLRTGRCTLHAGLRLERFAVRERNGYVEVEDGLR